MRLFLTLAFCTAAASAFAQWALMDGPYTGTVGDLSSNDTYLFATNLSGVFRSADAGDTWEEITGSNFGPDMEPIEVSVRGPNVAILCQRARFSRLRKLALFLSRDHGEHWTEVALPVAGDFYPSGKMVAVLPEKMLFVFGGRIWERPLDGGLWRPNPLDAASEYYARPTVMNGRVYMLGASSIMEAGLDAGQWEKIEVAVWGGLHRTCLGRWGHDFCTMARQRQRCRDFYFPNGQSWRKLAGSPHSRIGTDNWQGHTSRAGLG